MSDPGAQSFSAPTDTAGVASMVFSLSDSSDSSGVIPLFPPARAFTLSELSPNCAGLDPPFRVAPSRLGYIFSGRGGGSQVRPWRAVSRSSQASVTSRNPPAWLVTIWETPVQDAPVERD